MNKRLFRVLNFFAFNLLFFALYLNFIHKDKSALESLQSNRVSKAVVLVKNSDHNKKAMTAPAQKETVSRH